MEKFEKLGLKDSLLMAIRDEKFETPTEVQEKSIPLVLAGKDVIGGSATGSGKTLAFGSGIIQNLERGKGIQALILTPTRELCIQVAKALKDFSKYNKLNVAAVYGGVGIQPQVDQIRKADAVVGTPGRVLDHISRNSLKLNQVKVLVLDEADRMLDMGFIDDVEKIIRECPKERQTLLFSATISTEINRLCHRYMKDPVKVAAASQVDPKKLKQVYYDVDDRMKFSLLVHLLKHDKSTGLAMVFCNTRKNVDFVARNLAPMGIKALAIHGGFTQQRRTKTMDDFYKQSFKVLICTDVAARGLDIKGVTHVYNYDIPKDSKEYVHRIGRTARAGKEGKVINILSPRCHENFGRVQRENSEMKVEKLELPKMERSFIKFKDDIRHGRSGFGGGRGRSPGRGRGSGGSRQGGSFRHGGQRQHSGSRQGGGQRRSYSDSPGRSSGGEGLSRSERRARERGR